MRRLLIAFALCAAQAHAQEAQSLKNLDAKNLEALRQQVAAVRTITPIFSQLLSYSLPKGFAPLFQNTKDGQYIQESVPAGESLQKWTQMITVTGAQGLAPNPNLSPQQLAGVIAGGFRGACPDTFSTLGLGAGKVDNHDAYTAIMGCGSLTQDGGTFSETAVVVVLKGDSDYYTVQWAERGAAARAPIPVNLSKWTDKVRKLSPIRLCNIVAGEAAPYPSCLNRP